MLEGDQQVAARPHQGRSEAAALTCAPTSTGMMNRGIGPRISPGWDLVTARERVRVARKLAEFPVIGDALRRGEVSYSKVRAMMRVATPANEALLLDHARHDCLPA